ncbi:hypothetical protein COU74_01145 [Candidatus Peregrinibacteria bacterium CG10_big_fil_rev_8_21_14_0_10_36_19]|nr:MAG: hypothetical protein COU74_01145 [Candidatus Peregrinibacteria bacterium CG10_big_fil_rev_8_21_14_0_10_36_19]
MLEPKNEQLGELGIDEAVESTAVSVHDAISKLEASNDNVEIAGEVFDDKTTVYLNLKAAMEAVQEIHPNANLDKIYLQKFNGGIRGESRENGTYIDPREALNLSRLIHTILHEVSHQDGRLASEPVVDAYARAKAAVLGYNIAGDVSEEYKADLDSYYEWLENVKDPNESVQDAAIRFYEMYDLENYEGIFEAHERIYKNMDAAAQDAAFEKFQKAFPDLDWKGDGRFHLVDKAA